MRQRGFTLIELMVSVAIFSVVMVIALGALLSIAAADRKAETIGSIMNNLNFAIESMTRNIRTGVDYHCGTTTGGDCTAGGVLFKFTSATGLATVYKYDTSASCGQTGPVKGCILRCTSITNSCDLDDGTNYLPITAPEVVITNVNAGGSGLEFYLRGSALGSAGDNIQPNVVITVTGYVLISDTQKSQFFLQTSATQRLYDR